MYTSAGLFCTFFLSRDESRESVRMRKPPRGRFTPLARRNFVAIEFRVLPVVDAKLALDGNPIEITIRLHESTFALLPARHTRSIDLLRQMQRVCTYRSYYRSNVDNTQKKKRLSCAYRKIERWFSCAIFTIRYHTIVYVSPEGLKSMIYVFDLPRLEHRGGYSNKHCFTYKTGM